ncbi:MAG: hypothetical protein WBV94_20445 [Blastocatellia bacterium]
MEAQNDIRKQATADDVDGFINTLTLLLEGNRISDSTKETLRETLCNAANTQGEGDITNPENIRAWLANALNIDSAGTATEHENDDESKGFVIYPDEAEAQHAIGFIMKGITEEGLYILANILVELREMTSEGPEEAKKASDELGRIIELVFQHSRSYRQALRLYLNRFDIIGGGDPDEHISQLVDGLLRSEDVIAAEQ